MENIVILILFTYPGIMADYIHDRMTKGKAYNTPTEEPFRTARDFFISAMITVAGMGIFSLVTGEPFSLNGIRTALQSGSRLAVYLPMTLALAAIAAVIWYGADRIRLKAGNSARRKTDRPTIGETESVWTSMMTDRNIPFNEAVLAIYKDRQLIKAGVAYNVSDDYGKDPWAVLYYSDMIEGELARPMKERAMLFSPQYSFVNIENGITVDVYDGKEIKDYIREWVKSVTPGTAGQAAAEETAEL